MALIFGHRGAPNLAPENTISSFKKAIECGAQGFEFDLQLSQDGKPVIIHDYNLQRTTEEKGAIIKQNWCQLQWLNAGKWHPYGTDQDYIPSLTDVLTEFYHQKPWLNIELKFSPKLNRERINSAIKQIVSIIKDFPYWDNIIISSFSWKLLIECNKIDPELKLGLLLNTNRQIVQARKLTHEINFFSIHPHYNLKVTNSLLKKLSVNSHQNSKLIPWTVNNSKLLDNLQKSQHPPWAIITDYPEYFINK